MRKPAALITASLLSSTLLAGCASSSTSGSGADSAGAKEQHNCRIATLGSTKETVLRSYIEPDTTNHQGPITIDTYLDGKVILYYADDSSGQGRLVARDCGTGKLQHASDLTGIGRRYLDQATAIYEGTV